ncbi:MAG: Trk system potassium transporter TrkA [Bacilli bacterium]|nr:Trk system potassium transporter TrkA [Bacilli bacterium]MBP5550514.1 Trk system potassium transporter TrkA [Bacilli bacterium]
MNIIINGAGKIGRAVAEHLSGEGHNITVIDTNPKVIEEVVNDYDVRGIFGNGAVLSVLKEADADKADLLISVTPSDELNVMSCLVAKKMGTKQTIARVRTPDYSQQVYMMREELGLSMAVNPDYDAALEISRILRFPSAVKVDSFSNGKVDLVEIKLDENSPLIGKSLLDIHERYQIRVLVCAVCRGEDVFIPKGDFELQAKDEVYMTASPAEITKLFKKLNILKEKTRNVMIIGGSRIAYYLSGELEELGVKVKIVERDASRCEFLSGKISNALIINADGTDQKSLMEEGLDKMDALISLTGFDEENIIIAMNGKEKGVGTIIAKVNNTSYSNILDAVGIESVITPKDITTNHIIRYVRGMESSQGSEFRTLYRLVDNKVEALEFYIPFETNYTSIPLKDLKTKNNMLLACIIRNNQVIIPNGNDSIQPFDTVIIVTTTPIKDVEDILR